MRKLQINVLKRVLCKPGYLLLFIGVATILFVLTALYPNRALLFQTFGSESIAVTQKISLAFALLGSLFESSSVLSVTITLFVSVLFSLNLVLFIFYIRRLQKVVKGDKRIHLAGIGGFVSGLFGIGCAACGSIILTGILSLFGASGLLLLLPLHGAEFGLLGITLLVFSIYWISKRIHDPLVCRVD